MRTNHTGRRMLRPGRVAALLGVLALSLVVAAAAVAVDDDPVGDPPPNASKPNLLFSAGTVEPYGPSQGEIRYTVVNRGSTSTPSFHVRVAENGGATIKDTLQPALSIGMSHSEVIHVNRTGCYLAVRFTADSTHVVNESLENDNERVVTAMTSPQCPQL